MSVLVRDTGFHPEDWPHGFTDNPREIAGENGAALDIGPEADIAGLHPRLGAIRLIRIAFPSFSDGRGFTLARQLRLAGYPGRLRARGHLIADQYAMLRRCGFDEVELTGPEARRQPEASWLLRANWRSHDYQSRLRG